MTSAVEAKAFVAGLLAVFITQGFKLLGEWIGKDLKGVAAFVVFVATAAVLSAFDAIVAQVPPEYKELLDFVLKALIAIGGGSGVFRIYSKIKK